MGDYKRPEHDIEWASWDDSTSSTKIKINYEEKAELGWLPNERPPAEWMNWWQHYAWRWTKFFDHLPRGVIRPGRYGRFRVEESDHEPGIFLIRVDEDEPGFYLTPEGQKATIDHEFDEYHINDEVPPPFTTGLEDEYYRVDTIMMHFDPEDSSVSFRYEVNWDHEEIYPNEHIIAYILVEADPAYKMRGIFHTPHLNDFQCRVIIGDGYRADNCHMVGLANLQQIIDYVNIKGGGIIELIGNMFGDWHDQGNIRLKSNVIIDGINHSQVRAGSIVDDESINNPPYSHLFRMEGGYFTGVNVDSDGTIDCDNASPNINLYDYGIGSKVWIKRDDDIFHGPYYVQKISDNGETAMLVDDNYKPLDINQENDVEIQVLIANAGLRNLHLWGDALEPLPGIQYGHILLSYTDHCFINNCIFSAAQIPQSNSDFIYIYTNNVNNHLVIKNNQMDFDNAEGDYSIYMDGGSHFTIQNNVFTKTINLSNAGSGVYSHNYTTSPEYTNDNQGWHSLVERKEHNVNGTHNWAEMYKKRISCRYKMVSSQLYDVSSHPEYVDFILYDKNTDDGTTWSYFNNEAEVDLSNGFWKFRALRHMVVRVTARANLDNGTGQTTLTLRKKISSSFQTFAILDRRATLVSECILGGSASIDLQSGQEIAIGIDTSISGAYIIATDGSYVEVEEIP